MTTKGRRGGQGPVKSAPQVTMPSTSTQARNESASTLQTSKSVNTETSTSSGSRVTSTGSSKSKKRHGKTKGLRLAKIRKEGERFDVLIPSHLNRAVGDFSTMFGTELGVIVRQCAPLQAVSWETIDDALKCWMITHIREKFNLSNEPYVNQIIEIEMGSRYRSWRYRIHKKFLKFPTLNVALANRPTDIKENDWRYLCNLFSEEKFKERSEINKRNRAKLKTTHTARTKAFAKIKYDMRNDSTREELGIVELYRTTHTSSGGSWVNDNAGLFYEQLKELESKSKAEGTLLTDEQLSQRVFGRKPRYIIGLGRGPKPSSSASGQRTRAQLEREAFEATQRAEAAERDAAEARRVTAQLAERVQMLESHQTDMVTRLREEMSSQLALFHQQLLERNVPSTSASMQVICPSTEMM